VGVSDTLDFPDIGLAQKLSINVDLTNSKVNTLVVSVFDPNGKEYVLHQKSGSGTALKTSYPDPTKVVSGDLGAWAGKNPMGKWYIVVIDTDYLNNTTDGQINSWSISLSSVSNKKIQIKGDLIVDGNTTTNTLAVTDAAKAKTVEATTSVKTPLVDTTYLKTAHPWFSVTASDCWRQGGNGVWNEVQWNVVAGGNSGSWFNPGNGRFTAPVKGMYLFTANYYYHTNAGTQSPYNHYTIGVNGSQISGGGQGPSGTYSIQAGNTSNYSGGFAFSRMLFLNAGDYVSSWVYTTGGYYMCGYHSLFQGALLYQM
jgi:subtilisin-like proprotein convertase family protein